jgi:hypothetical protein
MIQYNYFDLVTLKIQFLFIVSIAVSTSFGIEMKNYYHISRTNWFLIFEDGVFNRLGTFFCIILFFYNWYYSILFFLLTIIGGFLNGFLRLFLKKIYSPYNDPNSLIGEWKLLFVFCDLYVVYELLDNLKKLYIFGYVLTVFPLFLIWVVVDLIIVFYRNRRIKRGLI